MKAKMFGFLSLFLFVCLLFSVFALPIYAQEETVPPSLDAAGQFALFNIENNRYILSKNLDTPIFPASTVKIMSGLIICELLSERINETVTLSADMLAGVTGKVWGLTVGQSLDIKSLMIAAFSGGYNDATVALSVIAAGSPAGLIAKMNERAALLGMSSTVYKNVTGLDHDEQVTTLENIIRLASAAAECGLFLETSSEYTSTVTLSDGSEKTVYGTNKLLTNKSDDPTLYCKSAQGMNAGVTDAGGAGVVTFAEHDNARYIVAATGCANDNSRFQLVQNALQYAYDNYGYRTIYKAGTAVGSAVVGMSASENTEVQLVLTDELRIFTANNEPLPEVIYSLIKNPDTLTAPLKPGDIAGKYIVWNDKTPVATVNVSVDREVEQSRFLAFLNAVKSYLTGRAFMATLIAGIVFSVAALLIPKIALSVRQKKRKYVRQRGGFRYK